MDDLIRELEQAQEGSREIDGDVWLSITPREKRLQAGRKVEGGRAIPVPHYTTNLQDALGLVPEGWRLADLSETDHGGPWRCGLMRGNCEREDYAIVTATEAKTPALALTIASLRAIKEKADG